MPGWTNRGKYNTLAGVFRSAALPASFYVRLVTGAAAPTADTNTVAELTQIAAGNGYTAGGFNLARNSTDFDVLTEDDVNDRALVQAKDVVWTATGGSLPASGAGARYAVLTDANVTDASREVWNYFDLVSDRSVSDTQSLTLQNLEWRLTE